MTQAYAITHSTGPWTVDRRPKTVSTSIRRRGCHYERACTAATGGRWRAGREDRANLWRGLAAPDGATRQLRDRLRGALLAGLQAGAAHAGGTTPADRTGPGQHRENQRRPRQHRVSAAERDGGRTGAVDATDRRSPRYRQAPPGTGSPAIDCHGRADHGQGARGGRAGTRAYVRRVASRGWPSRRPDHNGRRRQGSHAG